MELGTLGMAFVALLESDLLGYSLYHGLYLDRIPNAQANERHSE
jgi:hypothetical protein